MKRIAIFLIITFILNFVWEISQAFLYTPHYSGTSGLIKVHLMASLGDIVIIAIIFMINRLIFGNKFFNDRYNTKRLVSLIITGLIIAVLVEKYSLTTGRWGYNSMMPIAPLLNVGLTPILQMMLVPSLCYIFYSRAAK